MAEVGLVRLAQVALDVAMAAVPRYRTTFSKPQFTQPQLLAILCLMRYEDWTYREAEVRLAEHCELRRALRLRSVPDYTTLYRFLRRLDEAAITRALNQVVHRMSLPGPRRRTLVESFFSAAKRKFSCRAPGRSLLTQRRQALLLGLTYNLYRL
ncbi:MAG: transposase [Candidatus Korobacteraceae bacterium]